MRKEIADRQTMTRRRAISHFAGLAGLMMAMPKIAKAGEWKAEQGIPLPNILWLIADDVGWNDFGCYGHPTVRTANLDKLASQGIRFTNAFLTSSSCSPSRATMFTGKYPHSAGAEDLHSPLPPDQKIVPSYLRAKGYFSGNTGKLHLGSDAAKQFDRVYDHLGDWRKFLDERPKGRPFFLTVGFHDAHRPFDTNAAEPPYDPAKSVVPPYLPDVPEAREELALYYGEITRMDSEIGEILRYLDEHKLAGNTILMFWSDNGMAFPRAKTTVYDTGVGTPIIARWPGRIGPGTVQKNLASIVDMAPTMLEIAGIPVPADMQGRSRLRMFLDPDSPGRKYAFSERNWHDIDDHIRTVRTNRFRYIRNYYPDERFPHPADTTSGASYQVMRRLRDAGELTAQQMLIFRVPRPAEELYDSEKDPYEFHNVAGKEEYQEVLEELRRVLDRWVEETHDVSPTKRMVDMYDWETGKRTDAGPRRLREIHDK